MPVVQYPTDVGELRVMLALAEENNGTTEERIHVITERAREAECIGRRIRDEAEG